MRYSETLTPVRLTAEREAMKLTRTGLAERIGVDYQTVKRWEQPGVQIPAMAEVALRAVKLERALELEELAGKVRRQIGGPDAE